MCIPRNIKLHLKGFPTVNGLISVQRAQSVWSCCGMTDLMVGIGLNEMKSTLYARNSRVPEVANNFLQSFYTQTLMRGPKNLSARFYICEWRGGFN